MTEEEISKLYIRLAFQHESAIDTLLAKGLIDTDLAAAEKNKFYDSLNEEKLRTSKKIRDYHETICLYMRQMAYNDMVSLNISLSSTRTPSCYGRRKNFWKEVPMRHDNTGWLKFGDTFSNEIYGITEGEVEELLALAEEDDAWMPRQRGGEIL